MLPKNPTHIGALFGLVWIIAKLIFFFAKSNIRWEAGIILNLVLLPVLIFLGIRITRKLQKEKVYVFIDDLKAGMRPAALYSLIIGVFLLIYYSRIDAVFINDLRNDRVEILEKEIDRQGGWQEFKQNDEDLIQQTREEYIEQMTENIHMIISPFSAATASIIGLMLISFLYSLLLAIYYRKVVSRYV